MIDSQDSRREFSDASVILYNADTLGLYLKWPSPIVIVSDGAYGVRGFPGDPPTPAGLADWYEPHIAEWSKYSTPQTTLWFWNTELGWATVHPILKKYGWDYRTCHIWDKGMAHAAGNSNTQTLRKLPVVTEVCVQYTRRAEFPVGERNLSMMDWLRHEWMRAGLPFSESNKACGVKNAATRKYFTNDHLWYYPPVEMFERFSTYANRHGDPKGRPYFSLDGRYPISGDTWSRMRAKFICPIGITNVWREPPLNGNERMKNGGRCVHLNQKPLKLVELILSISSEVGDVVWEPFGGLCSVALASARLGRRCRSAEIHKAFYDLAVKRLASAGPYRPARGLGAHRGLEQSPQSASRTARILSF